MRSSAQNLILPAGTAEDRRRWSTTSQLNASPRPIAELNDLPIAAATAASIYMRDVAHVRDGYPPQTNIVRRRRPSRAC